MPERAPRPSPAAPRPPARVYPGPFSEVIAPLGLTSSGGVSHSFKYQGFVDWIRVLSLFYDPSVGLSGQILDRSRHRLRVLGRLALRVVPYADDEAAGLLGAGPQAVAALPVDDLRVLGNMGNSVGL